MLSPLEYAEQIAYSTKETLHFTYEKAKEYKDHPGVYVECGVAAGAQIIAMAYGAPDKLIYAFDSFQGIPLPSNRDNQYPGIRLITEEEQVLLPAPGSQVLESSGATSVSLEDFQAHLIVSGINHSNVISVRGWFEDTTAGIPKDHHQLGQIAILRLDGDLYNSTLVCLQNLFPMVIEGGLVIIDDYELQGCRDACIDYFQSIGYFPKYLKVSNTRYFVK